MTDDLGHMSDRDVRAALADVPADRTYLLPALWTLVERFGWISPAMMATLSSVMRIPVAEIYGVASFYALIPVSPRGAVQAHICTDILCQLQNGERLWQETSAEWAPQKVTVTAAHCLGRCEHAPAARVGSAIVVNATPDTIRAQIREALDE